MAKIDLSRGLFFLSTFISVNVKASFVLPFGEFYGDLKCTVKLFSRCLRRVTYAVQCLSSVTF